MLFPTHTIIRLSFSSSKNVNSTREAMFFMSTKNVKATNLKCILKNDIRSDFSDPEIKVDLNDGRAIRFKSGTLNTLEIFHEFNKIVLPLVVVKDTGITETKAAKLAAAGAGKKKAKK